jgi:hypothetical protein
VDQSMTHLADPHLRDRPGCLAGLLKLFLLGKLYDWLQDNFGFGRGCLGAGCGVIFFILFISFACSIILGTNWFRFGF